MLTFVNQGVSLRLMKRGQVLLGIFIVLVVLGIFFGTKKAREPKLKVTDTDTVETQEFENRFNITIPDDVEKIDLQASSGFEGAGVATRKFDRGNFSHVVIADLPDPSSGNYQAWLVKDDTTNIFTGLLRLAKGGYILEFNSKIDYSDYNKVEIRLQDKIVLSGSF